VKRATIFLLVGVICIVTLRMLIEFRPGCGGRRPYVELGQLTTAIQAYYEKSQDYPPCLAVANHADRKVRFMRHVQIAFPNSGYGTSSKQFDVIRDNLMTGTGVTSQPYNYKNAAGDFKPLDLETLDAAEVIVFWLGGFPTPINPQSHNSIANRRIFGFHRDADAPFRRDALRAEGLDPLRYRTDPMYQFDETRLVDHDDDGWLEYLPFPQQGAAVVAPYVYFDAATYSWADLSPEGLEAVGYPKNKDLANAWGVARPLFEAFNPNDAKKTAWGNPKTFQIVVGGFDGRYGPELLQNRSEVRVLSVSPTTAFGSLDGKPFQRAALDESEENNFHNVGLANGLADPIAASTDPDSIDPKSVR
jgi:hypothetical protein